MMRSLVKAMTVAAVVSGAALSSQSTFAMGFKNCTGQQIRIKIYNNNDVSKLIAKRNKTLGVNDYYWFKLDNDLYQVRIYKSRSGKDEEVLLRGGLNGGHKFSVRRNGSRYAISTTNDCSDKVVNPPKPIQTIAIDNGTWKRGKKNFRIGQVTSTSFAIRQNKGWDTYQLYANDRYKNSNGSTFIMTSPGNALWNGQPVRKK